MKALLFVFCVTGALLSSSLVALPFDFFEPAHGGDLRLRLKDLQQERRTTSVNWMELSAGRGLPAKPLVAAPPLKREPTLPVLRRFRVVIDAGHGGRDFGAQVGSNESEKTISLLISRLVKKELERFAKLRGILLEIRLSRDSDTFLSLRDRVRFANEWNADLFLSIHANSSPVARARGFEVYFMNAEASDNDARRLAHVENEGVTSQPMRSAISSIISDSQETQRLEASSRFAETIFQAMSLRLRANGRGVRQAPFTVLAGTSMPAVLVEVGYLTHFEDAQNLTQPAYLRRLANAIGTGIVEFANLIKGLG